MASLAHHLKAAACAVQGRTNSSSATLDKRSRVAAIRGAPITVASPAEPAPPGYVMNGVEITAVEYYMFDLFGKDSAVIPLGVFMTSIILASGLFSLQQKNRANQQYAMRSRVVAQGVTIGAMMTSLLVMERQKYLGIIPKYRDGSS